MPDSQKKLENLDQKRLYEFLDFHARVQKSTGAPYVRDFVTIDFLTDSQKMNYEGAEQILNLLLDSGALEYDSHGAFPGSTLTPKGFDLLRALKESLHIQSNPSSPPSGVPADAIPKPKIMHVWGKTQAPVDPSKLHELKVSDDILYRFFKFHLGVMRSTKVPYLRELVAEDFLMDAEHLSFKQTADLIALLVDDEYLAYDQFGAFPGTGVTEKGKAYFSYLAQTLNLPEK